MSLSSLAAYWNDARQATNTTGLHNNHIEAVECGDTFTPIPQTASPPPTFNRRHPRCMLPSAPQSVPAAARMPIQSTEFKRPPAYFDTKLGERYLLYDPAQGSTHPQWKYGKAVVILLVTSEGHTTEKMKQYKARMVPVGAKARQEVEDIGWVCLHPDTDMGLNADPDEDEIQAWVTDGRFLVHHRLLRDPDILEHIGEVSNKALGPVEDRTSNPPSGGKTPQGGIALERLLRRMSNDPGNAQVPEEDDVRSQLLQTLTEYAGSAMNAGPEHRIDLLENIGLPTGDGPWWSCRGPARHKDITEAPIWRKHIPKIAGRQTGGLVQPSFQTRKGTRQKWYLVVEWMDSAEVLTAPQAFLPVWGICSHPDPPRLSPGYFRNMFSPYWSFRNILMSGWSTAGPPRTISTLQHGLPQEQSRFWTGFQANISRPILSNNLGRAGDAHPDSHDQIGSFSALIVANDTPPGYTHAHFHLIELGLFIVMERETAIMFSGLRLHTRAPSMAPPSVVEIPPDIYSLVFVLYLSTELTDACQGSIALCPSAAREKKNDTGEVWDLPSEAHTVNGELRRTKPDVRANWMRDGHIVAQERFPEHTMTLLAPFLNHILSVNPEYSITFTPQSLALSATVLHAGHEEPITVDCSPLDPTWVAHIAKQWTELVEKESLLLGGIKNAKERREYIPRATTELRKLGAARHDLDPTGEVETANAEINDAGPSKRKRDGTEIDEDVQQDRGSEIPEELEPNANSNNSEVNTSNNKDSGVKDKGIKKPCKLKTKNDHITTLMAAFDAEHLKAVYDRIDEELPKNAKSKSIFNIGKPSNNATIATTLVAFTYENSKMQPTLETALQLRNIWSQINKATDRLRNLKVTSIAMRHSVMLATWRAWAILELRCLRLCQATLEGNKNWLTPLTEKIRDHLIYRRPGSLELDSQDFLEGVDMNTCFSVPPTMVHFVQDTKEADDAICEWVLNALGFWLGYPHDTGKNALWRDQGYFIEIMIAHTGTTDICFLEETWRAFKNPKLLIGTRKNGVATKDHWTPFEAEVRQTIRKAGAEEVKAQIRRIGDRCLPFIGTMERISNTT
ncbi:hypothetical protein OE88DRAFT_1642531 [Heliocybe sulcata]|uniref:Uncharacterized protein n=1 Tax=Heliocybe sulcata TaxID=5364 RepID=A0A5C3NEN7_9AGAM|nr:hypothetical protein OE88DRAFT_1642531 [Heliocybe sulcata]